MAHIFCYWFRGLVVRPLKKLFCLCVPLREENMSERLLISFNSYTYWFSIHILSFHEMEAFTSTLGLLTYYTQLLTHWRTNWSVLKMLYYPIWSLSPGPGLFKIRGGGGLFFLQLLLLRSCRDLKIMKASNQDFWYPKSSTYVD